MSEFVQEFELLEKIIAEGKDFDLVMDSKASGIALRHRLYRARAAYRKSAFGASPYDTLTIRQPELQPDGTWLMVVEIVKEEDPIPGLLAARAKEKQ